MNVKDALDQIVLLNAQNVRKDFSFSIMAVTKNVQ
jgi:hypothetical protein